MADKVAAYHEAGHTVLAVGSRFHGLLGVIRVADAHGDVTVTVSRAKLKAAGKSLNLQAIMTDPEIATDSAVVFLGGPVAESRYCQLVTAAGGKAQPDPALCKNDYNDMAEVLRRAGVKTLTAELEAQAAGQVERLWPVITDFAEDLFKRQRYDALDALDFIKKRLPT